MCGRAGGDILSAHLLGISGGWSRASPPRGAVWGHMVSPGARQEYSMRGLEFVLQAQCGLCEFAAFLTSGRTSRLYSQPGSSRTGPLGSSPRASYFPRTSAVHWDGRQGQKLPLKWLWVGGGGLLCGSLKTPALHALSFSFFVCQVGGIYPLPGASQSRDRIVSSHTLPSLCMVPALASPLPPSSLG